MCFTGRAIGIGAFAYILVSLMLFLVGYSTPGWARSTVYGSTTQWGLWKCSTDIGQCNTLSTQSGNDYLPATQAMASLALIAILIGTMLLVLSFMFSQGKRRKMISIVAIVSMFTAAVCSMLAVIIFASNIQTGLYYSFYLTLVSSLGMGIAGLLTIMDMRMSPQSQEIQ